MLRNTHSHTQLIIAFVIFSEAQWKGTYNECPTLHACFDFPVYYLVEKIYALWDICLNYFVSKSILFLLLEWLLQVVFVCFLKCF